MKSFLNFQARATSFNLLAARTIINGLLAYGWAFPEVLSLGSELMMPTAKERKIMPANQIFE
jgi:hypothetical protein